MSKINHIAASLLCCFSVAMVACSKEGSEKTYGFTKVYMPQAIQISGGATNNYPVPSGVDSSTYNYRVDKTAGSIQVKLGVAVSNPSGSAFSVDVQVNNDTVQQILDNGILDPMFYKIIPADMYTLPAKVEVPAGEKQVAFDLSFPINKLKLAEYAGKYLVLAVKIANATNSMEINQALSTTVVIVDVNALVIGPSSDVTAQYLQNIGPFKASELAPGQTRWGNLVAWTSNAGAKSHNGYGGYNSDKGGTLSLEAGWGSPAVPNGKVYQTINLPAGTFSFDISGGNWANGENYMKSNGYVVVAPGATDLPDYSAVTTNSGVSYAIFSESTKTAQPVVTFTLTAPTKVTVGAVVNFPDAATGQGFKSAKVLLKSYPKHL